MKKIIGMEIDIHKVIANLKILLRIFDDNDLATELKVNKDTFYGWINRSGGDWLKVIITYCREKKLDMDAVFSDDVVIFMMEKARLEGAEKVEEENKFMHKLIDKTLERCSSAYYGVHKILQDHPDYPTPRPQEKKIKGAKSER
jgi:hypothetical protein